MGWLANRFAKWAANTQEREIREFVDRLSALDGSELGMVVALATDVRHRLGSALGWDMLEPSVVNAIDERARWKIGQLIKENQASRRLQMATGLMVWLHTLRAAKAPDLRWSGRKMWGHLERGFPYCIDAAVDACAISGVALLVDGFEEFPSGFTPEPL